MDFSNSNNILTEIIYGAWRMIWYARNGYYKYSSLWTRRAFSMIKNHISEIHTIASENITDVPDIATLVSGIGLINDALKGDNYEMAAMGMESIVLPIITKYAEIISYKNEDDFKITSEKKQIVEMTIAEFTERLSKSKTSSEDKFISIVIPCHNVGENIDELLNNLIKQTIGINPLEIILVDDASTDNTLEVVKRWHEGYPDNIYYIHLDKNERPGGARNIGVKRSSTDYVLFIDADDSVKNDICEVSLEVAVATGAEVVSTEYLTCYDDGSNVPPEGYIGETERLYIVKSQDDRKKLWHEGLREGTFGKLYKREIFDKYDVYYPARKLYEDNYFAVLLTFSIEKYYIIEGVYYYWRYHESSSSHKLNNHAHFDRLDVMEMLLKELKKRGIYQNFKYEIDEWFLQVYFFATLNIAFTRFNPVPYERMNDFTKRFRNLFPDIRSSEQYSSLEYKYQRDFVDFAFCDLSNEDWDSLRLQYLNIIGIDPDFFESGDD